MTLWEYEVFKALNSDATAQSTFHPLLYDRRVVRITVTNKTIQQFDRHQTPIYSCSLVGTWVQYEFENMEGLRAWIALQDGVKQS